MSPVVLLGTALVSAGIAVAAGVLVPPGAQSLIRGGTPSVATTGSSTTGSSYPEAARPSYPVTARPNWPPPSSAALSVVGLGDSVPAGNACGCAPYVELVAGAIENRSGRPVRAENLAQGGLTTSDVLAQLQDPGVAASVAHADVVLVTVGANDLDGDALAGPSDVPVVTLPAYRDALAEQRADLDALLGRMDDLRRGNRGRVLVTGYWNVFLDGPEGEDLGPDYVAHSNAVTVADNELVAAVTRAHGDEYVDLYTPFKGTDGHQVAASQLASDGDHPSAAGHYLIAETVLGALFRPGQATMISP